MVKISFKQGTLLIMGNVKVPNATWDERSGNLRVLANLLQGYGKLFEKLKN
jgi:hypothetical protein